MRPSRWNADAVDVMTNQRAGRPSVAQSCRTGLGFLKFLQESERGDVDDKEQMKRVFLKEFKPTLEKGGVGFNFSSILYALKTNGKIRVKDGRVEILKGFLAVDQYVTLKKHTLDQKEQARATPGDRRVGGGARGKSGEGNEPYPFYCEECGVRGNSHQSFNGHLQGTRHRQQMILKCVKRSRSKFIENKNGIEITSQQDGHDGIIALKSTQGTGQKLSVTVKNRSDRDTIAFLSCVFLKVQPAFVLTDEYEVSQSKRVVHLKPGSEYSLQVAVESDSVGILSSPLIFAFKDVTSNEVFHILRFVTVEVTSEIAEDLPPSVPYQRPPRISRREPKGEIVEGIQLPQSSKSKLKLKEIKQYSIPNHLRWMLNNKNQVEGIRKDIKPDLAWSNYSHKLTTLLHIEECQMEVDIKRYDMRGVAMRQDGRFLRLEIPGLAENRPSVLKGDHLFARPSGDPAGSKTFKGYVHRVEMEEVVLGFSKELIDKFVKGLKFDIEFTFNRLPLRFQHNALDDATIHDMKRALFPLRSDIGTKKELCSVREDTGEFAGQFFDKKLASNIEQIKAVQHIVRGTSRPAPYLVFGPPGTGKTVTIVEAIKQVYSQMRGSRILACAPSNSAADLIATRLLTGGTPIAKTTIMRMNAQSRDWRSVAEILKEKDVCNYDKQGSRDTFYPPKEELVDKRILVTTLCTAGRLATAKDFPYDHFTHVFIDEAGHAVEPEAIISLANLLNPNNPRGGQVVLAGDPKQLGPILRSPLAIEHGLGLSLLERLMTESSPYQRQEEEPRYDSRVLTKLLRNYRSHPAILKLPNQMFYENELEVHADEMVRNSLCSWSKLPQKDFPILFHGVEGKDEREGQSPSFFNSAEVTVVVEYVEDLLAKRGGRKIKESDIGIISPYRRQVQKLQAVLRKRHHSDIKVGSVEEFQGQERLVIIVSTVRSTKPEHIQMDIDYKLGFVKNPKRLNVAITRAKALLVLVGNPYMLSKDECWNKFLQYCLENNAYTGCHFEEDEDALEDIIQKMDTLKISDLVDKPEGGEDQGVSAVAEQMDPEWRGDM
ncbi:putative helicase MOV-10 isoform X2 [Acanthaster planci]|uniref:RNA helicase n=1 Tax=Acanthaster planci TaxID=133434 RepID=A0A8B7XMS9_ACAPL|nr:putative helicase MOV-10 isoform X2 [Acanthaster planci]